MLFEDVLKLMFRKSEVTSFGIFSNYLHFLLNLSGFNVLADNFFVGFKNRLWITFGFITSSLGFISALKVIWRYSQEVDELVMGAITLLMLSQVISKVIALITHRQTHRQMLKIVVEMSQELQNNPLYHDIGILNFNRARTYAAMSSVAYILALISLILYPIYQLLVNNLYKLSSDVELPLTNHKEPIGWLINFVFSMILAYCSAFFILGKSTLIQNEQKNNFSYLPAYDVLFYVYVFFINERFQILEHLIGMIGDFNSRFDTVEKQHLLIIKCSHLHTEVNG